MANMADVFTRKKRSEVMSRIRGHGNKDTEIALIGVFRQYRITGWRRHWALLGKPDFVFPKSRVAVFVDGCFWHRCPKHSTKPAANRKFWERKLQANVRRDRLVTRTLKARGWLVVRIWEHDLRHSKRVASRIRRILAESEQIRRGNAGNRPADG